MKKIYILIIGIALCLNQSLAQTSSVRTNKTIVADVLAQLPIEQQETFNKQFADLASTGEEGVDMLIGTLNSNNKSELVLAEYALSGLAAYISAADKANARPTIEKAYIKGLGKINGKENKAFLISQLQLMGSDESVDVLGSYLSDDYLSGPAARALGAIGTEKALQALQVPLESRMSTINTLKNILLAIAEARLNVPENLVAAQLGNDDEDYQRVVLYTLSRIGSTASLKPLAEAAAKAGYTFDKAQGTEAYITLIKRIGKTGNAKEAEKAANELLKQATKAGQTSARIAAQEILFDLNTGNATKMLLNALKDPNSEFRNASLDYASSYADASMYIDVIKAMMKARPDVRADILRWIGREASTPAKRTILADLEIRFEQPARQRLIEQLTFPSIEVKTAAAWALTKIGDKRVIPVLANLLTSNDTEDILLAQETLASFPGDIDQAVAKVIPQAQDAGKIAGLQLLALRKADANSNAVYSETGSSSKAVSDAAYMALKEVVIESDFVRLCGMLETAQPDAIAPLQEAIIASIAAQPASAQVNTLNRRMLQAGEGKKHLYYIPLAATGDLQAFNTILNGFNTGKDLAKDQAFEALLRWNGPQTADVLYNICKDPATAKYFDRAINAYIQLASAPSLTAENRVIGLRKAMDIAKTNEQKNNILQRIRRAGTFQGMLFAGKYLDEKAVQQSAAQAVMNIALNNKQFTGAVVRDLLKKVSQVLDNPDAGYQREAIQKHLNEMPDEEGFVSIFNGKDLTGWKGLVGNPITRAKMTPAQMEKAQIKADEQMRKDWSVENGCLVFDGAGYDNLCSVKQYGDIEMYVDWMLDPSGKEADAGVYLRGTPQVQIWDTARVKVGAQVGSGGLYNNEVHESKPSKVADNPMGEWNSFYIKMVGDRVTVVLNGEKVVDNVILENFWNRNLPIFPVEQIELQAHGSKVYYRDLYIRELPRTEPFQLSAEEKKEGYSILFDGTNMHEWIGNTVDYTMDEGTISLVPSLGSGGNLYTKKEYGNFIFRFEFQLTPAANNGLGIRTPMVGDPAYAGMELQILDNEHPIYKDLEVYQYHGSVYGIIPAKRGYLKPTGEWNYQEVIANGDHIKITLNGEVILDGNIREATKNGTPDKNEHPGLFNKKGHIGFLGHGSQVKFRNIRIKELK